MNSIFNESSREIHEEHNTSCSGSISRSDDPVTLATHPKMAGSYINGHPVRLLFERLNFLEPTLVYSSATVIIPLNDGVVFVSLLNCAKLSSRLPEVAQSLDSISGIQFLVIATRLDKRWLLCAV